MLKEFCDVCPAELKEVGNRDYYVTFSIRRNGNTESRDIICCSDKCLTTAIAETVPDNMVCIMEAGITNAKV